MCILFRELFAEVTMSTGVQKSTKSNYILASERQTILVDCPCGWCNAAQTFPKGANRLQNLGVDWETLKLEALKPEPH